MELLLQRRKKTELSTIGDLSIAGVRECLILEDKDRGLSQSMSEEQILSVKVFALTAIPTGRYEIAITYSDHFKKFLPLIMGVKGFSGVRIHSGNRPTDSEGCLLTGLSEGPDVVYDSRVAFGRLFTKLKATAKKEKIFITIT